MHLFREITNVNAIFQNLTVIEQEEIIVKIGSTISATDET